MGKDNTNATVNCLKCSAKADDGPTKMVGDEFQPVGEQRECCELDTSLDAHDAMPLFACEKFKPSKQDTCPLCAYEGHEVKVLVNTVDDTPLEMICPSCGSGWVSWKDYARECLNVMRDSLNDYQYMEARHRLAMECLRTHDKQDMRKEAA